MEVKVRSVYAHNLEQEFSLIRSCIQDYPIIALDTEFPGTVFSPDKHHQCLTADERYTYLKCNVQLLNLIQVGVTLSNCNGDLPSFNTDFCYVWEFNFREFNIHSDLGNPDSIKLLRNHGIDFDKNRREGVYSWQFAELLMSSGMICNGTYVSWVTFHGAYDLAYLIKIITHRKFLPEKLEDFMKMVQFFFGEQTYDVKHMMKSCNGVLYGGLEKVASLLRIERIVGEIHQSGSDSLVTLQTFLEMRRVFFPADGGAKLAGVVYGLEI